MIKHFYCPLTVCKYTVSCSISLPSRGSFHLSLTVLVHCRSASSILPWRVVSPASNRISRVPSYSGFAPGLLIFPLQDYHLLWSGIPSSSHIELFHYARPTTPLLLVEVWALPISLAATDGISILITFPLGT